MQLNSTLPGVSLRYSRLSDAPAIMHLLSLREITMDGLPSTSLLRSARTESVEDMTDLIQTSFMSITATTTVKAAVKGGPKKERVVGFLAMGTGPRVYSELNSTTAGSLSASSVGSSTLVATVSGPEPAFPPTRWERLLHSGLYAGKELESVQPSNTLWASLFLAPASATVEQLMPSVDVSMTATAIPTVPSRGGQGAAAEEDVELAAPLPYSSSRLLREMLIVVLSVSFRTSNVMCLLPPAATELEALMRQSLNAEVLSLGLSHARPEGFTFTGTLLHVQRQEVMPPLVIRPGRIEDYDDFVPLLVSGEGVITALPEDFFLDETLKDQDAVNKVAVAEDPVTHQVIGLTCAHVLTPEEQQYYTKQYALEPFNKLRSTAFYVKDKTGTAPASTQSAPPGNTIYLDFLYFDSAYDGAAHELVCYLFENMFPSCEYVLVSLPHALLEPPILKNFSYLPIRQYQPHNSHGEFVPVPLGLWACSRRSVLAPESFFTRVVRTAEERALMEGFLRHPAHYDLKRDVVEKLAEDLCLSHERDHIEGRSDTLRLPSTTVFQLMQGASEAVGIASARRLTSQDVYALQANYDVDEYLSFYSHTGRDYSVTDVSRADKDVERNRLPSELSGVLIRGLYVKPAFRTWVRFLVREVMRLYAADVAFVLTEFGEEPYAPLVRELVPARPRRVIETLPCEDASEREEKGVEAGSGSGLVASPNRSSHTSSEGSPKTSAVNVADPPPPSPVAELASMHITSQRFLGDEKRRVHSRVIVIGASATALALLHAFLATPFAAFSNLVLISTDGLPPHPNQEPTLWRADNMELMEREYLALQQGSPIRVISGALVDVDRVNKFVSVDNGTFEPYDYLILAAGRQYVLPPSVRQLLQQEGRTGKKSVIPLNGDLALDRVRQSLAEIDASTSNVANVMVYGSGLDALAVAAAMVQEGFSAQRVVVCAREEMLPPNTDEVTYQLTSTLYRSLGINVFRGYDVSRMEFDDENNLCSVLLAPVSPDSEAGQSVELACCLVLCVEDKDIDANVLSTLNKRSIVFDGRVIVNRRYRTTDPFVFAAGPVAMWTRRYGTATPNFEDFSARDVGEHLAKVMLGHLGFEEYMKMAALPGKRAAATAYPGSGWDAASLEAAEAGDGADEDDDDADDANWNNVNSGTAGIAAEVTGNGTCMMQSTNGGAGATSPDFKRMSFLSNNNMDETAVQKQLRKQLPTYTTPICRRVRLPKGYHFLSMQCVDAALDEKCDALVSNTVDVDKFTDFSVVNSLVSSANSSQTTVAALALARESGAQQSVLILYVNRSSRRIDGVTYMGLEEPTAGNYRALIGLPETILNLVFRFTEAQQRVAAYVASKRPTTEDEAETMAASSLSPLALDDVPNSSHSGAAKEGTKWVNLLPHSGLTAGVRCGQLDLVSYLRLPHLQTIFYDRFTDFFRRLERRTKTHEMAMRMREKILARHKLDSSLTVAQIAAYQAELTAKRSSFKYEVQLSLIAFLHEHKNFRPHNMYLPSVERAVASRKAKAQVGAAAVTLDPTKTVC